MKFIILPLSLFIILFTSASPTIDSALKRAEKIISEENGGDRNKVEIKKSSPSGCMRHVVTER